ncbi:hypothetical protein [Novipirellula artificiosorum]|uniref:Uncharacterized protein n=1 Tax=Novipirellula artificiosorum TaxID=2528016 RepID=A0A5C6DVZ9_9BACT|nr:hypothetical protein [Novipirellula artificiosorum]TWU39581.1 hypothetical protein Poly41_24360 [Novipirellula artificiosorum]
MLWPLVLPFKITFWLLTGFVAIATLAAYVFKRNLGKTFLISSVLACLAFIPVCSGIMSFMDATRFGVFYYDDFAEVKDLRVERYLPPAARVITLDKFAMGHRAKYTISETELRDYLDQLWLETDGRSAIPREELEDGDAATYDEFDYRFEGLDWPPLERAFEFHSPVQRDGGGANYFFDPTSNTVYQQAGYW